MFNDYDIVRLKTDVAHLGLRSGDIGTILMTYENGAAYEVEFLGVPATATLAAAELEAATGLDIAGSGVDLLICKGPSLERVVAAVEALAYVRPFRDGDYAKAIESGDRWAMLHQYASGDIAFKVDLNGFAANHGRGLQKALAEALGVPVLRPDEDTLSPIAYVHIDANSAETRVTLHDLDDGVVFNAP